MDVPVKLKVALCGLLATVAISSVTTGVFMHTLMERVAVTERMSATIDELRDKVGQLESKQEASQGQINETTNDKSMLDAEIQEIASRLEQLENDTTLCMNLSKNHDSRISELETDKVEIEESNQILDARVSQLEADGIEHSNNLQVLKAATTQLVLNISLTDTTIKEQATTLTQFEIGQIKDRADIESLQDNITNCESKIAFAQALINDQEIRILQQDAYITANKDNISVIDAKVTSLEADGMRFQTNIQSHNNSLQQLAVNLSSTDAMVLAQETKITQLELARTTDRTDIEVLNTNVTELAFQRALDRALIGIQNNTISQLLANISAQDDAVDHTGQMLRNLTTRVELDSDLVKNISGRTALLESFKQSDLSTTEDIIESLTQLETKQTEIDNTLQNLRIPVTYLEGTHVGFTAVTSKDSTDPRIFQIVLYNSGSGFNVATGKFVCQRPGLYLFTATVIRKPDITEASCHIKATGSGPDTLLRVFANDYDATGSGFPSGSGTLIVHLTYWDEVYLTGCSDTYMHYESSFSGVLIEPDIL